MYNPQYNPKFGKKIITFVSRPFAQKPLAERDPAHRRAELCRRASMEESSYREVKQADEAAHMQLFAMLIEKKHK
jgi:dsRNA-specific ribonuclease